MKKILTLLLLVFVCTKVTARMSCYQMFNVDANNAYFELQLDLTHCGSVSMCVNEANLSYTKSLNTAGDRYDTCIGE